MANAISDDPTPLVSNIELTPLPVISYFGLYEVRADLNPNGTTIDAVNAITSIVNGEGPEAHSEFYTDGEEFNEDPYKKVMTNIGGDTYSNNTIRPDDVYPEIFFAPTNVTTTNVPVDIQINRSQYHIMKFNNPFKIVNNSSIFIEFYAEPRSGSSIDLQVYIVGGGESLSFFQGSDWRNDSNAELVGTINRDDDFNHTHGPNSKHHIVRLLTNEDGTIGNNSIDINGDFWIVLMAPTPAAVRSWDLKYHTKDKNGGRDNDGLIDQPLSGNATWYRGNATNWTTAAQSGLPDVHIHLARAGTDGETEIIDKIGIEIEVEYTYEGLDYTTTSDLSEFPFEEIPNLPPNASALINPQPCAYSGNFDISWVPATDPNGDELTYNVYLIDAVTGEQVGAAIATDISATSITPYDISGVAAGYYDIKIEACDAEFCTPFFWSGRYGNAGEYIYIGAAGSLYRSTATGDWDDNSVWEKNSGNCGWVAAGADEYPETAQYSYISSSHEITLNVEDYSSNIFIEGTLSAASGINTTNIICDMAAVIKCGGDWEATNFTPSTSEVIFNGTSEIKSNNSFYNLTIKDESETTVPNGITTEVLSELKIEAGGTLKQEPGSIIEVSGRLLLESSPGINATYLPGGTLTIAPGSVEIQQVINNDDHTYSLAVPVSGASASSIGINNRIYRWDNATGQWDEVGSEEVLVPGQGYICRSTDSPLSISGAINTTEVGASLSRSESGLGWNMIGNPFTASLDWNELGITAEDDIEHSFWMWLMPDDVYGVYNGLTELGTNGVTSLIPSNHSFFVKVKEGEESASLMLTPGALTANTTSYLKNSSANPVQDLIRISASSDLSTDEAIIAFIDDGIANINAYSSEKRFANSPNAIEVFSLNDTKRNAINALFYENNLAVPLGFNVQKAGHYSIAINSQLTNRNVSLFDLDTDELVLNGSDGSYEFYADKKMLNENRFLLVFKNDVITAEESPMKENDLQDGLEYFVEKRQLFLKIKEEKPVKWVTVTDLSGRLIFVNDNYNTGIRSLGNYNPGIYIINITKTNGNHFVGKVVIR
ncbi:T9SS type A sorting domain-containing protein [Alkalitalea saponilacus]|nr:T9SS type A sorting domain-containing protein [Alkalitalea saponilacus]